MTLPDDKTRPFRVATLWIAAMLSGGAALSYEIAWSRSLVVPLGNSNDAAALVLAAFMLGIGVGAYFAGKIAERVASPLRLYALAEVFLGVYALAAPHLLAQLVNLSGAFPRRAGALLLILIPCLAMGASLPLLVRALTRPKATLDLQVGIAYGANTAGAAAGSIATGFWGLALFGISSWSAWASIGSFASAALALAVNTRRPLPSQHIEPLHNRTSNHDRLRTLALISAFVMGFVVLANEMLWARVLTFVFGHDTYAFATLLAIVLLGLALGGLSHRLIAKRNPSNVMAALLGAFAVTSLLSFWIAAQLVIRFGRDPLRLETYGAFATSIRLELLRELAYTPILVLVPSIIAGAAFPTACSLFGRGAHDVGRRVGSVTLVNGIGAASGALAAAFGLATLTGIQGAFVLLALISALTASAVLIGSRFPKPRILATAFLPPLATGIIAWLMPPAMPKAMILSTVGPRHQVFLYYEEARTGTVSVIENQINQERQLLMNAVNEVTTRLVHDQSFKVLGHLAPLLHPNPKQGVMICLGAGISAGAALTHPLESLDIIDLSAAVAQGARSFTKENNGVLDDPRFHLHIDDGRLFLLNSREKYDVAIIDSTHPKAVDSWILYTLEFYSLVRSRLAEGGVVVQWLPLHGLSEREFKIILRTFLQAFPKMTLWANVGFETYGQVGYAKLVGTKNDSVRIDREDWKKKLDSTNAGRDLADYGMYDVNEVLDLFVAGHDAISAWTNGLPVQTDNHPIVPYTTTYSTGRRMVPALLLGVREPVAAWLTAVESEAESAAIELAWEAQGLVISGKLDRAAELRPAEGKVRLFQDQVETTLPFYLQLADRYRDNADKQFEAATQLASLGHPEQAKPVYERALALRPKDYRTRLDFARLLMNLGETGRAVEILVALRREHPRAAIVHHNLGLASAISGNPSGAAGHFEAALVWDPNYQGARLALARTRLALGETARSEAWILRILDDNPWDEDAHHLLGHVHARAGDWDAAQRSFEKALGLDPYRTEFLFDVGMIRLRRGAGEQAESVFRKVLRYDPGHVLAMQGLGRALSSQGHFEQAEDLFLQALELEPGFAQAASGLGIALRGQERIEQAIDAFCLALRIEPSHREAERILKELKAVCVK